MLLLSYIITLLLSRFMHEDFVLIYSVALLISLLTHMFKLYYAKLTMCKIDLLPVRRGRLSELKKLNNFNK